MQTLDIFGKKYQIQTGLSSEDVERMNLEIVGRIKTLAAEYPALDRIDILILYIVELNEKIDSLGKRLKKEGEKFDEVKNKILFLEKKLVEELNNL